MARGVKHALVQQIGNNLSPKRFSLCDLCACVSIKCLHFRRKSLPFVLKHRGTEDTEKKSKDVRMVPSSRQFAVFACWLPAASALRLTFVGNVKRAFRNTIRQFGR